MMVISKEPLRALYKKVDLNDLPDPEVVQIHPIKTYPPSCPASSHFYTADQIAVS